MKINFSIFFSLFIQFSFAQSNTQIKFFGQPGFTYSYNKDLKTGSPYFRNGQFIVYVTSQLSERVSIAGELNAHYEVSEEGPSTEVERLYLRYTINDNFALRIGKTYNPIGFWNLNYNLGLLLQPTISRPLVLQPTHDGGVTQTRDVGVMLEGENLGSARFFFKAFIANGRGKNGGQQGTPYLLGKTISSTGQIGIEPTDGLKLSLSGIYNPLQKGQKNEFGQTLKDNLSYSAISASVTYFNSDKKVEFIAEYYNHTNSYDNLGSYNADGAILYLGIRNSTKVTPYFYGEHFSHPEGDPFYPTINTQTGQKDGDTRIGSLGFRYKFLPEVVFKMEAGIMDQEYYGTSFNGKTQLAFSF
jgi:hypothetical protein